jgi:hypothetical protein
MDSVVRKIEYRFLFECESDAQRFTEALQPRISRFADYECITDDYDDDNIAVFNLLIHREIFNNDEEYLKILIKTAQDTADCGYIEETINLVNDFKPERTRRTRCIECQGSKGLNCVCIPERCRRCNNNLEHNGQCFDCDINN